MKCLDLEKELTGGNVTRKLHTHTNKYKAKHIYQNYASAYVKIRTEVQLDFIKTANFQRILLHSR